MECQANTRATSVAGWTDGRIQCARGEYEYEGLSPIVLSRDELQVSFMPSYDSGWMALSLAEL
jgi:hypothetical protein